MIPEKTNIWTHDSHALHHWWPLKRQIFEPTTCTNPQKVKESNQRPCTTPPLTPQTSKIWTLDHALHHNWRPKRQRFEPKNIDPNIKDHSNPRPCTTPPLTPKSERFEPPTCTTPPLTPTKSKIRTHDHALHHHWWLRKDKDSNPRPCTSPPLTPQKSKIWTHDHALHHHWPPKRHRFEPKTMHCDYTPLLTAPPTLFNGVHGYWWRHCTHKPKAPVTEWWENMPWLLMTDMKLVALRY
jgi:hypothetical protein